MNGARITPRNRNDLRGTRIAIAGCFGGSAEMNLREGTRRLALLLGVAGAILGGFVSYFQLQSTMRRRAEHKRFEQFANSEVLQRERKVRQAGWESMPAPEKAFWEEYTPSRLNADGMKVIHWTENWAVASIETADGQTLYPTPAPATWSYILIAISPLLGFFISWGAVRAIGWVFAGFAQVTK